MEITVGYFNILKDISQRQKEVLNVPAGITISGLMELIGEKYGDSMRNILFKNNKLRSYVLFAVNGRLVKQNYRLKAYDELYIVMSVTGG